MSDAVVIVGAGLAGLACACELQGRGIRAQIIEASDRVGGRVRTDSLNGFLLDRGFQVLLTAYPETRRLLNYGDLHLRSFHSGALIRSHSKWLKVADPTREPKDLLATAFAPVGSLPDRLRILRLRHRVCSPSLEEVLKHEDVTTAARLGELGFSQAMISQFFRPFLSGIFLENKLETSSRKFEFVFRMFSGGTAALPQRSMSAIPEQLAKRLAPGQIRFNEEVVSLTGSGLRLVSGEEISARCVVIATDMWGADRLLQRPSRLSSASVRCLYFAAPKSPVGGPWLVLNGESSGPINNLCVPSEVQSSYAPAGQSLISVTVLDEEYLGRDDLEALVRSQLSEWYGLSVTEWRLLRSYGIEHAVPVQGAGALNDVAKPVQLDDRLFCCGDYTGIVSIEGALSSGVRAAAAIPA